MNTMSLSFKETTEPDFSGFYYIVEAGQEFDADDYAEARGINRHDIDEQDISAVQNAAARLSHGEWLIVDHDIES